MLSRGRVQTTLDADRANTVVASVFIMLGLAIRHTSLPPINNLMAIALEVDAKDSIVTHTKSRWIALIGHLHKYKILILIEKIVALIKNLPNAALLRKTLCHNHLLVLVELVNSQRVK